MTPDQPNAYAPAFQDDQVLDPALVANGESSEEKESGQEQCEQHSVLQLNFWHINIGQG